MAPSNEADKKKAKASPPASGDKSKSKDNDKENVKAKNAPDSGKKEKKDEKAMPADNAIAAAEAKSKLASFRPGRRLVPFVCFVLFCMWILLNFNPCKIKKKEDCGYSGISAGSCMTVACFTKGGGELTKKNIKLKRGKDDTLGLVVADDKDAKYLSITGIDAGVVQAYNAELEQDSEDRILTGDTIWKVAGEKGKKMRKALAGTGEKTLEIEIRRSKLHPNLRFLHNPEKVNFAEVVLTAPGFLRFGDSFMKLSLLGLNCWFFSGYPAASLPMYFTIAGGISWYTNKCCHDEKVSGGTPHCYKGGASLDTVVKKSWKKTQELAEKVMKDPQSYWTWIVYG